MDNIILDSYNRLSLEDRQKIKKEMLDFLKGLYGVSFIGVNEYESSTTGEIANYVININFSVENAKRKDLSLIENAKIESFVNSKDLKDIAINVLNAELTKLVENGKKNLSDNPEERTNQSKGQSNAYWHITPSLRLHLETNNLYILGQRISKTVIKAGNKPAKKFSLSDMIKHSLGCTKYVNLKIDNISKITINKNDFQLK